LTNPGIEKNPVPAVLPNLVVGFVGDDFLVSPKRPFVVVVVLVVAGGGSRWWCCWPLQVERLVAVFGVQQNSEGKLWGDGDWWYGFK
jgi:hypothetical protein